MLLLIGALTIGLILSLLALGVFISFRIFEFADITADGSITLGGAVAAVLIVAGVQPARRHRRRLRGGRARRHDHRRAPHALQDQPPALRHPRDDGALLRQPARHGQEQRAAAVRAHAGDDGRVGGDARWSARVESTSSAGRSARATLAALALALFVAVVVGAAALPVLPHQPRHGDAGGRRQRADDSRARRQRGPHDGARPGAVERPDRARRRAARAVPGLRRRADGHRHGGVGPRQHHHRRGAGRRPRARLRHHRRGHGLGPVPADRRDRAARRPQSERPEADHRGLRLRRAGAAARCVQACMRRAYSRPKASRQCSTC